MRLRDRVGQTFGRLRIISVFRADGVGFAQCRCECGGLVVVRGYNLTTKQVRSCGCLRRELAAVLHRTHGESGTHGSRTGETPEHRSWRAMRERCLNPKHRWFASYGGRGIAICQRWLDSYEAFLADVGRRPAGGYTIDRIDNDGNYEPGNVRWATAQEQANNRRPFRRAA